MANFRGNPFGGPKYVGPEMREAFGSFQEMIGNASSGMGLGELLRLGSPQGQPRLDMSSPIVQALSGAGSGNVPAVGGAGGGTDPVALLMNLLSSASSSTGGGGGSEVVSVPAVGVGGGGTAGTDGSDVMLQMVDSIASILSQNPGLLRELLLRRPVFKAVTDILSQGLG